MIAKVTSKGQVTLPSSIRKSLKIKNGDKLDFAVTRNGEILVKPVSSSLHSLAETLPPPKRKLTIAEMDTAIKDIPSSKE